MGSVAEGWGRIRRRRRRADTTAALFFFYDVAVHGKGRPVEVLAHSQHFSTFVPVSVEARSTPDAHWKVASGGGGETSEGAAGGWWRRW